MASVQLHLQRLGIGLRYKGYSFIVACVNQVVENEECLQCATQQLYAPLAQRNRCRVASIERNIRTAIDHAWENERDYLCRLAGCHLQQAPSVKEFLDILATAVLREQRMEGISKHMNIKSSRMA